MIVESPTTRYTIGPKLASTTEYQIYLCEQEGSAQQYMFQIATDLANNGILDFSAYILGKLQDQAIDFEEEYTKIKDKPNKFLNYQLFFPAVVESFRSTEQGDRRVNVLEFKGVTKIGDLVPLYGLVNQDKLRVDVRTSIWILGKLLKTIAFAHDAGIAVTNLGLGNILIEPKMHRVVIFNWANAQVMDGGVDKTTAREEIRTAARNVIEVLGGTPDGEIPNDGSEVETKYINHLKHLAGDGESESILAHKQFYELVDSLWPRGFHVFTTLPRR